MKIFLVIFILVLNNISLAVAQNNNALHFDGIDDYVEIQNSTSLNSCGVTQELTIEFWAKFENVSGIQNLIAQRPTANNKGFVIELDGSNLKCSVRFGSNWYYVSTPISVGQWEHYAIVAKGSDFLQLYINGILSQTAIVNGVLSVDASLLRFGANSTTPINNYYKGCLDEIRIWNTIRSNAQIQYYKDYELIGNEADLLIYYNFNQGFAGGYNPTDTILIDVLHPSSNGFLVGFGLNGSTSNWLASGTGISCVLYSTCLGEKLNFEANNQSVHKSNYTWEFGGDAVPVIVHNKYKTKYRFKTPGLKTAQLSITDPNTGCISTQMYCIYVNEVQASIVGTPAIDLCNTPTTDLIGLGASTYPSLLNYFWEQKNAGNWVGIRTILTTLNTDTLAGIGVGKYQLTVTDELGCEDRTNRVEVNDSKIDATIISN